MMAALPGRRDDGVGSGTAWSVRRGPADELGRWVSASLAELLQTDDHREGVAAFLEQREPTFVGK